MLKLLEVTTHQNIQTDLSVFDRLSEPRVGVTVSSLPLKGFLNVSSEFNSPLSISLKARLFNLLKELPRGILFESVLALYPESTGRSLS